MITEELTAFVRRQLAAGVSKERITALLMQNGWSLRDVTEAIGAVVADAAPIPAYRYIAANKFPGTKVLLSLGLIVASTAYAFSQYSAAPQSSPAIATDIPGVGQSSAGTPMHAASSPAAKTQSQSGTTVKQTPTTSVPPPATTPTSVPTQTQTPPPAPTPTPAPAPAPKPAGQYADGSYMGSAADAYYGLIQVKAVIQGGKIADVQFLQYPSDRSTSRYINSQAMPILTSEAIQAQSANVDIVSGATDSSMAFQQSLASALA